MLMAHIAATSVFLVLLLCSASLCGSTTTEISVTTASNESSSDKQDNGNINKEVEKELTKFQEGRKMGGFEVKKDSAETGKVTVRETKLMGSSTKDVGKKDTTNKTVLFSKLPAQPDANQNQQAHRNRDVVKEMFNMLSRDYNSRARRRGPINNALPLDSEEP